MHLVCRMGFCCAYAVSHWYVDNLICRLKRRDMNSLTELSTSPRAILCEVSDKKLIGFASRFGINLNVEQLGALRMSDSEQSAVCAAWMTYYFSLVGDQVPDSDSEIHLEPIPKKNVYSEYRFDMEQISEIPLQLQTFLQIWKKIFSYVKVRKYKQSCGHCNTCAMLSDKRRQFRDRRGREEITNLYALHRLSTMQERRRYYSRRLEAQLPPQLVLSTISDGMQQNHCMLPWFGHNKMPAIHIKQHLQGVLMHGKNMTIYRTFANVGGGANLAIHTWLLSLDELHQKGELPKVLYHQIDGGSENANKEMYAICELLVASGLVDKVVLTRLPVGHTHEDIDANFALIWRMLRDEYICTPSEFSTLIYRALKKKVEVSVIDLFVLPDYCKILEGCIDVDIGRFAKEEWTQLQFTFERVVTPAELTEHPLGVKTSYRAYASEEYIEIVEDTDQQSLCGLVAQLCEVQSYPLPSEKPLNFLKNLPSGDFSPAPFIAGSFELTSALCKKMIEQYSTHKPKVAEEWKEWLDISPKSNSAQDFVTEIGGIFIPLRDVLFSGTGVSDFEVECRHRGVRGGLYGSHADGIRRVKATACVLHNENKTSGARKIPPRVVVRNCDGSTPTDMVGVLPNVYPGREEQRAARKKTNVERKEARAKKARLDARRREEGWDCGDIIVNDSDDSNQSGMLLCCRYYIIMPCLYLYNIRTRGGVIIV